MINLTDRLPVPQKKTRVPNQDSCRKDLDLVLTEAAYEGRLDDINQVLNPDLDTALTRAIVGKQAETVVCLINLGAKTPNSGLMHLAKMLEVDAVRSILTEHNVALDNVLIKAVNSDDTLLIRQIINAGFSGLGHALSLAAQEAARSVKMDILNLLLESGANPNRAFYQTLLDVSDRGMSSCYNKLVSSYASYPKINLNKALYIAATATDESCELIEVLIDHGAVDPLYRSLRVLAKGCNTYYVRQILKLSMVSGSTLDKTLISRMLPRDEKARVECLARLESSERALVLDQMVKAEISENIAYGLKYALEEEHVKITNLILESIEDKRDFVKERASCLGMCEVVDLLEKTK